VTGWQNTTHDWARDVDGAQLALVRRDPAVFAPGGVTHLVLEVLAYVADEATETGPGQATVTFHADGSISVADDGRGTDTRVDTNGRTVRKPVMATKDLRYFDDPTAATLPDGHPRRGMSVVAALSDWLVHTNRRGNGSWSQRYENGVPATDLIPVPDDGTTGTTVRFRPSRTLDVTLSPVPLRKLVTERWSHLTVHIGQEAGVDAWRSEEWRRAAGSWLDERLADAGLARTGKVEQPRIRPWGTVLTAPTTGGPVWLKAPGSATAFEVPLYDLLRRVAPDHVLEPVAVDVARGWVLLPDGGTAVRDGVDQDRLLDAMVSILPQYGQFQRDLMSHVDTMLSLGVVDMRAEVMPERLAQALDAAKRVARTHGDPRNVVGRLSTWLPDFAFRCARLADAVVPASLDHNDLHLGNVLRVDDRIRFYDWGDAVVAHPFASMLVGLGMLPYSLGVGPDDPAVLRARDAYLEPFTDLAPAGQLVEELELACWVAKPARALVWDRAVRADPDSEFATAPLAALGGLLADSWLDMWLSD